MKDTIYIKKLLGDSIRSRNCAKTIEDALEGICTKTMLDMSGVVFVSRSFADELLNIQKKYSAEIVNADGDVKKMLEVVKQGKGKSAQMEINANNVIDIPDMAALHSYFAAM